MKRLPGRVQTAGQKRLWPLVVDLPSIESTQPLAQVIFDALMTLRASPQQLPVDPTAARQYICSLRLPPYYLPIPEPYAAKVIAAFKAEEPHDAAVGCRIVVQALNQKELKELPPGHCAPFPLGGRRQLTFKLLADEQSYLAQLGILLRSLGETLIKNVAYAVIDPDLSISFTPNPYCRSEDSTFLVWDSFLDALSRDVESRCEQLERSLVANAFPEDEGHVPNNQVVTAALLAINSAGPRTRELYHGWYEDHSERPTYRYEPTRGKTILVYPTLAEDFGNELKRTEVLWNYVERLGPDTGDVALAVLAQMCEPSVGMGPTHPMLMPVTITDDAILEYRDIDRNCVLERSELHSHMESLRSLSFDVDFSISDSSGRGSRGFSWQGDRLFHIVRMEQFQEDFFGERRTVSTMWAVRAGLWACRWFSSETRLYIGKMARVLLALGSRGKRGMAKKLGQRLLLLSQVCRPRGEVTMFIRTLLADAGELLSPEARDSHWASRTRTTFEEALLLLKELRVLKTVQWPDGFGPDDIDREKGWVNRWLDARICVRSSISVRARSDSSRGRRVQPQKAVRPKDFQITGAEIRSARANIIPRWSQEALARHLGIERAYLSQIETDKRKPSAALSGRLRTWMDSRKKAEGEADPQPRYDEEVRSVLFAGSEY